MSMRSNRLVLTDSEHRLQTL